MRERPAARAVYAIAEPDRQHDEFELIRREPGRPRPGTSSWPFESSPRNAAAGGIAVARRCRSGGLEVIAFTYPLGRAQGIHPGSLLEQP